MNPAEKPPGDDEVPIGREELKPDPEKDTMEISPQDTAKKRRFLIESIKRASSVNELCDVLKKEEYGYVANGVLEAADGIQDLIKDKKNKEELKYTLSNVFEDNKDLFKGLNLYDEEINEALKSKLIELLKKEAGI